MPGERNRRCRPLPPIYVLLDLPPAGSTRELLRRLDVLLRAGARLVQLRAKHLGAADLLRLARPFVRRCRRAGATSIVNDRADIAAMAGADGVHLGATDLPVAAARRAFPALLVGATVRSEAGALRAVRRGADYVAIGPMAPTRTKRVPSRVKSVGDLRRIVAAVPGVPVVAVGGITAASAALLLASGAASIAVASALAVPRPDRAYRRLARACRIRRLRGRTSAGERRSARKQLRTVLPRC